MFIAHRESTTASLLLPDAVRTSSIDAQTGAWLWDYETGSLWRPHAISGSFLTGVSGVFADQSLEEFPSIITTWREWVANNPDSKYVKY